MLSCSMTNCAFIFTYSALRMFLLQSAFIPYFIWIHIFAVTLNSGVNIQPWLPPSSAVTQAFTPPVAFRGENGGRRNPPFLPYLRTGGFHTPCQPYSAPEDMPPPS